jgi:hypothetical protein
MMTEDLSIFLNADEFASPATVGGQEFNCILDRDWAEVNGVEGYYPHALCKAADVAALTVGAQISIAGAYYTLLAKRPDGTGLATIVLEAV